MKRLAAQLLLTSALLLFFGCSPSRSTDSTPSKASRPAGSQNTSTIVGRVVGITDGDTVTVLDADSASYKVRLQGIDSPEKRQAFGDASRRNLADLIAEKTVTVEWQKLDQYGRIIGKILVDDRDVCLEQVEAGFAWHYKQFEGEQSETDRKLYSEAEEEAHVGKRGLWQDVSPVPPWDFRHNKGLDGDAANKSTENTLSSSSLSHPTSGPIWGNRRSGIYHWPGCPNYNDISPSNRVPFSTREEAEKAGFRPARNCP